MNPPMHKRVRNLFVSAGLTQGYEVQNLIWVENPKNKALRYIVFRPSGGTPIDGILASEYYVMVDVVTLASGDNGKSEEDVQTIIDYVQQNPLSDPCVGQITNMGGIPSPVQTEEGRLVWRLQFACLFGG